MTGARGKYVDLPTPTGVQRWRIAFKSMRDFGCCDWGCKTIWLRPNQTREELCDTLIHEAAHVASGVGSEPAIERLITRVAQGATAMLLRLDLLTDED